MSVEAEKVSADSLKEQGNEAIKENKFEEASLYYTHAIKLDPQNHTLYSNRSLAYLKMKLYSLALSDAQEAIDLSPTWPKGYFRKGEVEFATAHYTDAYESYREALRYKPDDVNIMNALNITAKHLLKQQDIEKKIPWVGAGIGIVFGVVILIGDVLTTKNPTHPLLMAIITIAISIVGYGLARSYRSYIRHNRNSLLKPPPGIEDDIKEEEDEKEEIKRTPRYTKSQARLRYKKGKA